MHLLWGPIFYSYGGLFLAYSDKSICSFLHIHIMLFQNSTAVWWRRNIFSYIKSKTKFLKFNPTSEWRFPTLEPFVLDHGLGPFVSPASSDDGDLCLITSSSRDDRFGSIHVNSTILRKNILIIERNTFLGGCIPTGLTQVTRQGMCP